MPPSSSSKFTYFCGANAQVFMDGLVVSEGVKVDYALYQNRMPLYGYNAPEFSAVAHGQILVQGRIYVNYVSHEYLLALIRGQISPASVPESLSTLSLLTDEELEYAITSGNNTHAIAALKEKYWAPIGKPAQSQFNSDLRYNFGRPDQHTKSIDMKVTYGDIYTENSAVYTLKHVFFRGRSMETSITEDPQIEVFDFIARTII